MPKGSLAAGFEALEDDEYWNNVRGVPPSPSPPLLQQQQQYLFRSPSTPMMLMSSSSMLHCSSLSMKTKEENGRGGRRMANNSVLDEIDEIIEQRRQAEEVNLIDFNDPVDGEEEEQKSEGMGSESGEADQSGNSSGSGNWGTWQSIPRNVPSSYRDDKIPKRAIMYDYTTQPIGIIEHKREFLAECPPQQKLSYPFLRPILIDGVGLIKAYRGCCSNEQNMLPAECLPEELHFPFMPIVRCLFYWISRGHRSVLYFPQQFSPVGEPIFRTTDEDKRNLKQLEKLGLCVFFEHPNSKQWFDQKREEMRACLVTTVPHYLQGMPSNLYYSMSEANLRRQDREMCPDRLLQPFYHHKGALVLFSLFNTKCQCVESIVLDSQVQTRAEFDQIDAGQLSFVEQVVQLQTLYRLLPRDARVREINVMVELFGRLKPFL